MSTLQVPLPNNQPLVSPPVSRPGSPQTKPISISTSTSIPQLQLPPTLPINSSRSVSYDGNQSQNSTNINYTLSEFINYNTLYQLNKSNDNKSESIITDIFNSDLFKLGSPNNINTKIKSIVGPFGLITNYRLMAIHELEQLYNCTNEISFLD